MKNSPSKDSSHTFTTEQKKALCQQWQESGLSRNQFSKQKGVSLTSLCNWLQGKNLSKAKSTAPDPIKYWVPLSLKTTAVQKEEALPVEVVLPNQITLKIHVPSAQLKVFIEELSHAFTTLR